MKLTYVPLLQVQRDLYAIPRGRGRFKAYIARMVGDTRDLELPLVDMNPMGKEHLPELLDRYLEVEADTVAERAMHDAAQQVVDVDGEFRVTLILSDDWKGGWTDRHATEWGHRFESRPLMRRGWLTGLLWSSESPSIETVRSETIAAVLRAAFIQQHGFATSLGQMLAQEGFVLARAGAVPTTLDAEELAFTREVIAPLREATDRPTVMVALYGDEVARKLGYQPLGLGARAGLALAVHEAVAG